VARAAYTWETVRSHPVAVLCILSLIVGFLTVLTACLTTAPAHMRAFQFLGGQRPIQVVRYSAGGDTDLCSIYSVPGDVQASCAAAQSELSALGYADVTRPLDYSFYTREYQLRQGSSGEAITIRIIGSARLRVYSTPKNSRYSSPDRYRYKREADWLSVEVVEHRGPSWLQRHIAYPVRNLFWRLGLYKDP
jgi:hypothetical protein